MSAEHPAVVPVAVILNDVRNRKVSGTPREIAQQVINVVLAEEVGLYKDVEMGYEGGQPNGVGTIEENTERDWFKPENETHHRLMILMTGPWKEGTAAEARARDAAEELRGAKSAAQAGEAGA